MTDTKTGISGYVAARSSCTTTHDHQVFFHSDEALPPPPALDVPHFLLEKPTEKKPADIERQQYNYFCNC